VKGEGNAIFGRKIGRVTGDSVWGEKKGELTFRGSHTKGSDLGKKRKQVLEKVLCPIDPQKRGGSAYHLAQREERKVSGEVGHEETGCLIALDSADWRRYFYMRKSAWMPMLDKRGEGVSVCRPKRSRSRCT